MFDRCFKEEADIGELSSDNFRYILSDLELDERGWQGLKETYESYKQIQSTVPK